MVSPSIEKVILQLDHSQRFQTSNKLFFLCCSGKDGGETKDPPPTKPETLQWHTE